MHASSLAIMLSIPTPFHHKHSHDRIQHRNNPTSKPKRALEIPLQEPPRQRRATTQHQPRQVQQEDPQEVGRLVDVHAPAEARGAAARVEDARGQLARDARQPDGGARGRRAAGEQVVQEEVRGDGQLVVERARVVGVALRVDLALRGQGDAAGLLEEADAAAFFY